MSVTSDSSLDLEFEEALDDIDPLRHLRNADESNLDPIVPSQIPSILGEIIQIPVRRGQGDEPDITIQLVVDASPGCGGIAWPAGEVLSSYLVQRGRSTLQGKTIVELGSGTGLVGLVAGFLGANVWITDQRPLLEIMHKNVEINGFSSSVTVSELNWGEPITRNHPKPDLILAADCVYFEPAFPLLVKTLTDLAPDKTVEILFCYKKRRKADKRFFSLLKKHFTWTEVTDDLNKAAYSRESISLLNLIRKRGP